MAPGLAVENGNTVMASEAQIMYQKGVKHLCDNGLNKLPSKYILPNSDRPDTCESPHLHVSGPLQLPVIDFAQLLGPNRHHVIHSLTKACEEYGFFQVINHGISNDAITNMREVCSKFFELPYEERAKYMSSDMHATVRYGTSFNQNKDNVYCWRDFLKLTCNPNLHQLLSSWPSSPSGFKDSASTYVEETRGLFLSLVEAIVESLGKEIDENEEKSLLKEFEKGSQLMVVNCYPKCPEPELTLGMPPHSDYGFLTLLLQDQVEGLQIHYKQKWVTVQPLPNSFVVNIGDHLEIFSNGKYKSVLHRVVVNAKKTRISVATLHSLPFDSIIKPWPKLVNEENPRLYRDTDFGTFLDYISSFEPKRKNFLESRKIIY
ncbi:probable 2-oxoglutarate-dependent dioxygenase SLC1 [Cucumis melo]|uniref:Probable 2-oxoglutarate-dependent dioxygenase SLC1 n=1 Tax=Cucumis melo TaxID=3656 RepID=A0A1S3B6H1_CUCME|nr:probable 2-oxoglutarate-dependent dioxygenase SLC1 [Cucumis melo]